MFTDILGKVVAILTNLPDNMSGGLLDLAEKLNGSDGQSCFDELLKFLRKEPCWTKSNRYLRKIATGTLGETTGEQIFAEEEELFLGGIDPDFANWCKRVKSLPTEEALFDVFEQVEDGTFKQILEGFGGEIGQLFFTEAQAVKFVTDHRDKLHPKGWATFVPFVKKLDEGTENERTEFFVADVHRRDGGRLMAFVGLLPDGYVWRAEHRSRFVVPQLKTSVA